MPTPLPVIPGVYYARVEGVSSRGTISNIFTWKKDGVVLGSPDDALNALAVSVAIAANWPVLADLVLSTDYVGSQVSTYPLGSPLIPAQVAATAAPGGRTGSLAPVTTAIIVAHEVFRRGRGSQSRTNFSPVSVSQIDPTGANVETPTPTTISTAFNTFITDVDTALIASSPGTWTYSQLSKHPTPTTFLISTSRCELALSTQRRRARRV